MSKKFLVPIDLNQLEIQNVRLQNLATAPGSPVAGQMYYNTTTNKAMIYNGSAWIPWEADTSVSPATTAPSMDGTAAVGTSTKYAREDHVHPTDTSRAPTNHASSATTYGTGTSGDYGHVKLSDSTASTLSTSGGTAATPKAVKDALDAAKSYADEITIPADNVSYTPIAGGSIAESGLITNNDVKDALNALDELVSNLDDSKVDKIEGKGLSTNDYTTAEKNKLSGIASGAEVNQNAFSNVKVGSTTVAADAKTDTLELAAGSNVTLTPDATNDKVTIAATDTKYEAGTTALITSGTDTTERVWQAKILHDYIGSIVGGADAMRFRGTIGTGGDITELPTSGVKIGDTYRVITAGTYAGQTCEIGDLIIATATTPTWTVAQTNIDGAITSISGTAPISVTGSGASRTVSISAATTSAAGSMSADDKTKLNGIAEGATANTGTVTQVASGTGLTGGPITTTGTLSLATVHSTAPGAKGDTSAQTPGFGSTFKVPSLTVDQYGRVTAVADHTVTIPNTAASTSAAGLMSKTDKSNLNAIVNNHLTKNVVTLTAGQTSVPAPYVDDVVSYTAIDKTTHEEVVVDYSTAGTNGAAGVFSIAAAYSNDIEIRCACYE